MEAGSWALEGCPHLEHRHDRVVCNAHGGRIGRGVRKWAHAGGVVLRDDLQTVPWPDHNWGRQTVPGIRAPLAGWDADGVAGLIHCVVQVAHALAVHRLLMADRSAGVKVDEVQGDAADMAVAASVDKPDARAVLGPPEPVPASGGRGVRGPERLVGNALVGHHEDALLWGGTWRTRRDVIFVVLELCLPVDTEEIGVVFTGIFKEETLLVVEGRDLLRLTLVGVEQHHAVLAALGATVQRLQAAGCIVLPFHHGEPHPGARAIKVASETHLPTINRLICHIHNAARATRAL
mmetsp:Transcript_62448/g.140798  ORF Transcript_62448/g.140798 Transcript_62448/m.140798 type:complete len:292 (+) Transcript_62448:136-1011(+)